MAAGRQVAQRRRHAGDALEGALRLERGQAGDQQLGIGVQRVREDVARPAPSSTSRPAYMTPRRSTNCAISPMSWPTRMTAAPSISCTPRERLHHLPLHDHIQRAGRLVGDDHLRVASEIAMAMQTRCFMPPLSSCGYMPRDVRAAARPCCRRSRDALRSDLGFRDARPCSRMTSSICSRMRITGLSEFIAPCGIRAICEQAAACASPLRTSCAGPCRRATPCRPRSAPAAGERSRRQRGRRLAGARLADEAEPLAGLAQREADAVDGSHRAFPGVIVDAQVAHAECHAAHARLRASP